MPKKQPKNAFFFFMLEYQRFQEAAGKRFPGGLKEVANAASEPWKSITPREKERYEKMAKQHKAQDKKYGERYSSQGKPLSQVALEEEEEKRKVMMRERKVVKIIDEAIERDALETTSFYIVSFNYFYKETTNVRYYPGEVGMVRFSIKGGITTKFHNFINPGPLPLGSARSVKEDSEKTHKLPVPPNVMGEEDYSVILGRIIEQFVEDPTTEQPYFPIFVLEEEMEMTEAIFRSFCENDQVDFNIHILPLKFFFHKLRAAVDKAFTDTESQFTRAVAEAHISTDIYQYNAGNGCSYHEQDDVNIYCALSRSTRWAYYIIDQTIGVTGGKKKPGYHFPKGCVVDGLSDDDGSDEDEYDNKSKVKTEDNATEYTDHDAETLLKVDKHEFDDDTSTVFARPKELQSGYASSRCSTEVPRGLKEEEHSDTDDTASETTESLYSRRTESTNPFNQSLNPFNQSYNPFHKDNFPALGAAPKNGATHSRFQHFAIPSDSDDSSAKRPTYKERTEHQSKGKPYERRTDRSGSSGSSRSSTTTDPKYGSEEYLRAKYEKLKKELAALEDKEPRGSRHESRNDSRDRYRDKQSANYRRREY